MSMLALIRNSCAALILCVAYGGHSQAQSYPTRPIRLIVPYTPGGPSDIVARLLGEGMTRDWGQAVIIENRPGASGIIAHTLVAKSPPDGYTLIVSNFTDVLNTSLGAKLSYNFTKDFQPISELSSTPFILVVNPALPIHSLQDLVSYAKANPNKLTFGSSGTGTGSHLAGELLKLRTGISMIHVPYKGVAPASQDVISGQISLMFLNASTANGPIKSGLLRALGVSTAIRTAVSPDVPTMEELGIPDFDVKTWNGIQAPAGTPMPIVDKLSAEARKIMLTPDLKAKLLAMGSDPIPNTPAEFKAFISSEVDKWTEVGKTAQIHVSE